jgi:hypothetical protein
MSRYQRTGQTTVGLMTSMTLKREKIMQRLLICCTVAIGLGLLAGTFTPTTVSAHYYYYKHHHRHHHHHHHCWWHNHHRHCRWWY